MCDPAAEECPVWLGPGRRVHKGYPDPAKATCDEEEILPVFRRVRDEMLADIPTILKEKSN